MCTLMAMYWNEVEILECFYPRNFRLDPNLLYCQRARRNLFYLVSFTQTFSGDNILRDDYLQQAQEVITDPMILVNVVSRRAKQLKSGYKPLIESLERLSAEDMALREIIEGKITYQLDESEDEEY